MKKLIILFIMLFSALPMQGCEKKMNYEAKDYFKGKNLEVAKVISDGDRNLLKKEISAMSNMELNLKAKEDMTLLFWAILNSMDDNATPERLNIITDLVKAGADPLLPRDKGKSSPAEFVMKASRGVWIRAMLDGGLNPNAKDRTYNEPIVFESRYAPNNDSLKVMLDYGVDKNIRNSLGQTLLMSAFLSSSFEQVKLLLEKGAEPNPVDDSGLSMITIVNREIKDSKEGSEYNSECKVILALMKEHGAG